MRFLFASAAASLVLHVAGLVLAATSLRPGSPAFPLDERMAYLAAHPAGWTIGWTLWIASALAFVAFVAALLPHGERRELAAAALGLAALGATVDLACDVGQMLVLPDVAAWTPPQPALFAAWERWLGATGVIVANGLYSTAVLAAAAALKRVTPRFVFALGIATGVAGFLMVAAGFTGRPRHLELTVGATMAAFLSWTAATTWALARRR